MRMTLVGVLMYNLKGCINRNGLEAGSPFIFEKG